MADEDVFRREHVDVSASELLEAMAGDHDRVDLSWCQIIGKVDILAPGIRRTGENTCAIRAEVSIRDCTFQARASFSGAEFQAWAIFDGAEFQAGASFHSAKFQAGAGFQGAKFQAAAVFDGAEFQAWASFDVAKFQAWASFSGAKFQADAVFQRAEFQAWASFSGAKFQAAAVFDGAEFQEWAIFDGAEFQEWAIFGRIRTRDPIDFASVCYRSDTVGAWWCARLRWMTRALVGRAQRPHVATSFLMDSNNISEETNPILKRYVADQHYVRAFRARHPVLAKAWRWSSDYGRSLGLWFVWSMVLAAIFGAVFATSTHVSEVEMKGATGPVAMTVTRPGPLADTPLADWLGSAKPTFEKAFRTDFTPYYFSAVTFTTLGFGDVLPDNLAGERWVLVEVLLGYVMLGGLISIFANKLARRS